METSADHTNKSTGTLKTLGRYFFTLIVLGLGVNYLLPKIEVLYKSFQVMRDMALWAILLAIVFQVISFLGRGYLIQVLVRLFGDDLSLMRATMISLAAISVGMVAGGVVASVTVTYLWLRNSGVRNEGATLTGTVPILINNVLLLFMSIIGMVHLFIKQELRYFQVVSFGITLVLLCILLGVVIWFVRHRQQFTQIAHWCGALWARVRKRAYSGDQVEVEIARLYDSGKMLVGGGWRKPLLGGMIYVVFEMFVLYALFLAIGYPVSMGALLTGYALPILLARVSGIIPGGIGVIETAMIAIYVSLGMPDADAVAVVLVYRLVSFWAPMLLGFPAMLILQYGTNE